MIDARINLAVPMQSDQHLSGPMLASCLAI